MQYISYSYYKFPNIFSMLANQFYSYLLSLTMDINLIIKMSLHLQDEEKIIIILKRVWILF